MVFFVGVWRREVRGGGVRGGPDPNEARNPRVRCFSAFPAPGRSEKARRAFVAWSVR
jgi:hypothetical protein